MLDIFGGNEFLIGDGWIPDGHSTIVGINTK
jgi:hypothetical protein